VPCEPEVPGPGQRAGREGGFRAHFPGRMDARETGNASAAEMSAPALAGRSSRVRLRPPQPFFDKRFVLVLIGLGPLPALLVHRHSLKPTFLRCAVLGLALLWAAPAVGRATTYDPPAGYYAAAERLTGPALKAALHSIIRNHNVIPYTSFNTDTWDALRELDRDTRNPSNVRLVYSNGSAPAWDSAGDGNPSITAESWEREHLWPRSAGVGSTGADTSDLFNLRPIRSSVNSSRGNRFYAQADLRHPVDPARVPPNCPECLYDYYRGQGGIWTPRPEEKGDLARAMFYMVVRYDGRDAQTEDLQLSDDPERAIGLFGILSDLLQWHLEDPVSEEERLRNHLVYTRYQGNRNPFVDHPEWVAAVFGALPEGPPLMLTVTPSVATGGETVTGRLRLPAALAQPLTVRLVKIGSAGDAVDLPAAVTFAAGQTEAAFDIAVEPGAGDTGELESSIIALAPNYQSGAASLLIPDTQDPAGGATDSTFLTGPGYYRQDFDTLPVAGTNNWTDDATLPGWYAQRTGSSTTIVSTNGNSTTGGLYSFGMTGGTDRALGSIGSGTAGSFAWGVAFRNDTAGLLTFTSLSFVGEQWRSGGTNSAAQTVSFSYQIGSGAADLTPDSDSAWTLLPELDFTSPVNNATSGWLDGNDPAHRVAVSSGLDLLLAPGAWITFRWRDVDHAGTDHGLAIDDFRLDWSVQPAGEKPSITSADAATTGWGEAFQFQISATGSPAFYEAEDLPPGLLCSPGGFISGTPQTAGTYAVRVLAVNGAGAGTGTLVLTVDKATPVITGLPAAAALRLGQPLSAATLTGGAASVPGSFAFKQPSVAPPFGFTPQTVVFTPDDAVNYAAVERSVGVGVFYATGFEDASKGSYAAGTVGLDGINWDLTDVLVGALAGDFKNGTKSARLRGHATSEMTMLSDLPGGIGRITFEHGRYGNDAQIPWIVEYSANRGETWTEAGRFTAGAEPATFDATLDLAGPARVRIRAGVSSGAVDRRANLDDIVITPYAEPLPPVPEITSPLFAAARVGDAFSYQLTALHSPDVLEIEDLPPGLAVDPLVPGRLIGRPSEGGTFELNLRALNAAGEAIATLRLDIARSSYADWSGPGEGASPGSSARLAAYAIGGATGPAARGGALSAGLDGDYLSVSAVVRTDDPDLVVTGMAVDNLADFAGSSAVPVPGERAADQAGVPAGHEHRIFRVPIGNGDTRKFFRLHIELGP
jgi:endonuclease I